MSPIMTYDMECDFIYALIWNQLIWFHEFMMIWWWNRAKLQKGFHWLPWFLKLLGRASGRFPKTLEEKWRDMEGHSNWPKYPDWIFLHFTEANTRDHSKCPSNLLEVPKRFKCSQQVNTNQQQLFETSNLCWFWLLTTQTKIFPSMALASFRSLHQPKIYGLVSMISVILDCQVAFRSWWQQASNLTKALIFLERFPITLFYSHQIRKVFCFYVTYCMLFSFIIWGKILMNINKWSKTSYRVSQLREAWPPGKHKSFRISPPRTGRLARTCLGFKRVNSSGTRCRI